MIFAVVFGERVFGAVKREPAFGDAVAVTTDQRADVRLIFFVIGNRVVTENDVGKFTVFIRRLQRNDRSAVSNNSGFRAL